MRVFRCSRTAVVLAVAAVASVVVPAHALTSKTTWQNTAFQAQSGTFTATFDVVPAAANMDGVTALSAASVSAFTGGAVMVRFNDAGMIDARNGGAYAAATAIPYTAGKSYRFRLVVNVSARTYSAYVTPAGAAEVTLGANYAFRTEQNKVTTLANWALIADPGTMAVNNFAVVGTAPVVNAGADMAVTLPASASLKGTVTTGGSSTMPSGMTLAWTKVSGPGTVTFAAPTALASTATFSLGGTYTLQLAATYSGQTVTDQVVVQAAPALTIAATPTSGVAPLAVQFSAMETGALASHLPTGCTLKWSFGDGSSASGAAASHTYSATGTFTAALTLTQPGSLGTVNYGQVTITASAVSSGLTSTTTWQNTPFTVQTGSFTAEFDAVPNAANIDAVTGLSASPASSYAGCAAIVRFNGAGTIDARNAGSYAAVTPVTYTAGTKYHFRMAVNVPAHTYSAYVTPVGGTEQTLATDYAFRTEQASVTSLANWAIIGDPGTHTVSNFVAVAGSQPTLTASAGNDATVAAGSSATLSGSATGGTAPYTYSWSPTTGLNNPAIAAPVATPTATTTYTLTVRDSAGKTATDTAIVTVTPTVPPLTASAGNDATINTGSSATLSGSATGGTAPYTYSWTPTTGLNNAAIAAPVATPTATTTYTLTVKDAAAKTATDTVIINVTLVVPPLTANAGADASITAGSSTVLNGSATGGTAPYTYSWTPTTGLNSPAVYNPTATPTATTTYTLTVKDAAGKTATDSMIVTVNTGGGSGTTYYVSPSGNDSNAGTAAAPWKTINKAATTATAGATVIVKAGTYNESLKPTHSGTASQLITFKSETPRGAILDGGGSITEGVDVQSTSANYIRVDGFEIRNFSDDGVTLNDWYTANITGMQVVNCYVHDNGQDALNFRNSKNCLIEGNEIYKNGKTAVAMGGQYGSINLVVRSNKIHYNWQDGIQGNSVNLVVEYNQMYDQCHSDAHQDAFQLDGYTNCTIRYNFIADFTQLIYGGLDKGVGGHCDGLFIYGNVLYNSVYWSRQGGTCPGIFIAEIGSTAGSTMTNFQIYNNTFLYLGDGQKAIILYGDAGITMSDVRIYNNIFYQCRGSGGGYTYDIDSRFTNIKSDYNCFYNMTPLSGQDTHSITTAPKFVSYTQGAATFDVHLQPGSPGINVGAPNLPSLVTLPSPYLDLDGKNRPQGSGYDMGAYEQ